MSQISNDVMKKVKRIYWMRKFTTRQAGEAYLLLISFGVLSSFVSIPHIIANMPKASIFSVSEYMTYAATHTQFAVQILLFALCLSFVAIVADFVQVTLKMHKYSMAR